MATFTDNVFDVFKRLSTRHGFIPAKAFAGKHFASLVKRLNDDCYAYIFIHDGRSGGAELVVSVWIAPPDAPDDRLDKLNVGYKIRIAGAFDISDEFFHCCEERIVDLIPAFDALSKVVQGQLAHQEFRTKRWTVYQSERQAFAALRKMATNQTDMACEKALAVAKKVALSGNSFGGLEKECIAAAESLLDYKALPEDAAEFYEDDADLLGSSVSGHLYVDALVTGGAYDLRNP